MEWNFMNILMFFGIVQGFLLSIIVLIKKKDRNYAAYFLAIMLFGLSMNLLYYFLRDVGIAKIFPVLEALYLPWPMLSAVCFYLYIVFSAPFQKRLTVLNKWAFLPFAVFSIIYVVLWFDGYYPSDSAISFINVFEEYFAIGYALFLGFLSYAKLNGHEYEIQLQFSTYNISKLIFHRRLLIIMLLFCALWMALYTYVLMTQQYTALIYYALWVFMALVLQWIAWTGFINDDALLPEFVPTKNNNGLTKEIASDKKETKTQKLTEDNAHFNALIELFEKEQIYKNPVLSLSSLAVRLGISKSYVSALINQATHKNFYEFVNEYRIHHVIDLFKTNKTEDFTILGLAYESGFNSKSTFQAAFKKSTSKTPSAFIKDIKNRDQK